MAEGMHDVSTTTKKTEEAHATVAMKRWLFDCRLSVLKDTVCCQSADMGK